MREWDWGNGDYSNDLSVYDEDDEDNYEYEDEEE